MDAPKIIYLQWSEHPEAEVTWCVDQAAQDEDVDVEYVRKDIVDDLLALLNEWLHTPYFHDYGEWYDWVGEFKPRVHTAIAKADGK